MKRGEWGVNKRTKGGVTSEEISGIGVAQLVQAHAAGLHAEPALVIEMKVGRAPPPALDAKRRNPAEQQGDVIGNRQRLIEELAAVTAVTGGAELAVITRAALRDVFALTTGGVTAVGGAAVVVFTFFCRARARAGLALVGACRGFAVITPST